MTEFLYLTSAWLFPFVLIAGFLAAILLERFVLPSAPILYRPVASYLLALSFWAILFSFLFTITGRFSLALSMGLGLMCLIVLVSNAKYASLREPFTYRDFRYLRDALRYPRLYLPFLGIFKGLMIVLGVLGALILAFWVEPPMALSITGIDSDFSRWCALISLLLGVTTLVTLYRGWHPQLHCVPEQDITQWGFWASLFLYQRALKKWPNLESSFKMNVRSNLQSDSLPHMVAVQSESFFDPRPLFSGIRDDVLQSFDLLSKTSKQMGQFKVPAWGANTVRTEFGFLSGVDERELGVHRFNPYASILEGLPITGLATYLKSLGYRTVCIHPYSSEFYSRDQVFPLLGFDEFIDVEDFAGAPREGAYISDAAVGKKVLEVLESKDAPTFIFVITMENHGPLHLEKVKPEEMIDFYHQPPPSGCEDLAVYLRHLRNADRMLGDLCQNLAQSTRPVSVCWYGDHVPIMTGVYKALGFPQQNTAYLIWDSRPAQASASVINRSAHQLACDWIAMSVLCK